MAVDPSYYLYVTDPGANCSGGSSYPAGQCIMKTENGTSRGYLSDRPGAVQITADLMNTTTNGNNPSLYALDSAGLVWHRSFAADAPWTKTASTICGGPGFPGAGTIQIDQIAAWDGTVWGIGDNGGAAGNVYVYTEHLVPAYPCWDPIDKTHQMMSISANPTTTETPEYSMLMGTDSAGKLYYWCYN